jgi:hypothetical protein
VKLVAGCKSQVVSDRAAHVSDTEVEWLIAKTKQGMSVVDSEKGIVKKRHPASKMQHETCDPNAGSRGSFKLSIRVKPKAHF